MLSLRENFRRILAYEPFEHMPVWYFGTWPETKLRWRREGMAGIAVSGDAGPEMEGMDPDWEAGMWDGHGLLTLGPLSSDPLEVLESGAGYRVVRTPLGALLKESVDSSSIPLHLEEALQPTRASWQRFLKFLDPGDPQRWAVGWQEGAAALRQRTRVITLHAGTLFGWLRDWMGVEQISYLAHDDPILFEEMIDYSAEYFMALCGPLLRMVDFDFVYFFEDCCGSSGPLFSPATYRKFYHRYYRKMIEYYKGLGTQTILMDSDGKTDALIPCWLDSGFDLLFPVEVGKWQADPVSLRRQYGRRLRMMGGVNKHVIPLGEQAIRAHLLPLKALAADGGYIPIPDHRIPPDCSLDQFRVYLRVFQEIFNPQSGKPAFGMNPRPG